jgi:hypothetical protein
LILKGFSRSSSPNPGLASTEDLRQVMIHYRTLFEEPISEPDAARPYNA